MFAVHNRVPCYLVNGEFYVFGFSGGVVSYIYGDVVVKALMVIQKTHEVEDNRTVGKIGVLADFKDYVLAGIAGS